VSWSQVEEKEVLGFRYVFEIVTLRIVTILASFFYWLFGQSEFQNCKDICVFATNVLRHRCQTEISIASFWFSDKTETQSDVLSVVQEGFHHSQLTFASFEGIGSFLNHSHQERIRLLLCRHYP